MHAFEEPGEYRGTVRHGDRIETAFYLSVDKDSPVAAADIDLARLAGPRHDRAGCCCEDGPETRLPETHFTVNPRGYVVFRVSGGKGGYSVNLRRADPSEDTRVFNSTRLEDGQLFTARLLHPGAYTVANARGEARAVLTVSPAAGALQRLPSARSAARARDRSRSSNRPRSPCTRSRASSSSATRRRVSSSPSTSPPSGRGARRPGPGGDDSDPRAPAVRSPGAGTLRRRRLAFVDDRLPGLADAFALGARLPAMTACCAAILGRPVPLPGPAGTIVSRLSADGTPIQFATALGPGSAGLRFVADPNHRAPRGAAAVGRARAATAEVAAILGADDELAAVAPLLARLAPEGGGAAVDAAGPLWIGAAFSPAGVRMRVYVNGSGPGDAGRLPGPRVLAAAFGHAGAWEAIAANLPSGLAFLGAALTLTPGGPPSGALYFRAFGLRLATWVALAGLVGGEGNARAVDRFGRCLLGDDARYPTTSAVASFAFASGRRPSMDLEFCAHCLFRDDREADRRVEEACDASGIDPGPYRLLARHLRPARGRPSGAGTLAFVGVDGKADAPSLTVYLKPDLSPYGRTP